MIDTGRSVRYGRRDIMTNLILFINSFLSYLLLFAFTAVLVVVACVAGAKWRKSTDARQGGAAEKTDLPGAEDMKQGNTK